MSIATSEARGPAGGVESSGRTDTVARVPSATATSFVAGSMMIQNCPAATPLSVASGSVQIEIE
jgi:hypothetical protein